MTKTQFRFFLFLKLPIAFVAGLKLYSLSKEEAKIYVKLGFMNQNPFKSMFWAVQGMAAELSTGTLCIEAIQKNNKKISMLVIHQQAEFTKKAVGKLIFTCNQGKEIRQIIDNLTPENPTNTLNLYSEGIDQAGDTVSKFSFTWSFKLKT